VFGTRRVTTALRDLDQLRVQVIDQHAHGLGVEPELLGANAELGRECGHGGFRMNQARAVACAVN
jgi:hypothetical protein